MGLTENFNYKYIFFKSDITNRSRVFIIDTILGEFKDTKKVELAGYGNSTDTIGFTNVGDLSNIIHVLSKIIDEPLIVVIRNITKSYLSSIKNLPEKFTYVIDYQTESFRSNIEDKDLNKLIKGNMGVILKAPNDIVLVKRELLLGSILSE